MKANIVIIRLREFRCSNVFMWGAQVTKVVKIWAREAFLKTCQSTCTSQLTELNRIMVDLYTADSFEAPNSNGTRIV